MGHANTTTTLTIYTHLFDRDRPDAVRRLKAERAASRSVPAGNIVPLRKPV